MSLLRGKNLNSAQSTGFKYHSTAAAVVSIKPNAKKQLGFDSSGLQSAYTIKITNSCLSIANGNCRTEDRNRWKFLNVVFKHHDSDNGQHYIGFKLDEEHICSACCVTIARTYREAKHDTVPILSTYETQLTLLCLSVCIHAALTGSGIYIQSCWIQCKSVVDLHN